MYEDTMDKWDDAKLRSVVLSKAGNPRTTTDVRSVLLLLDLFCSRHCRVRLFVNTLSRQLNLGGMGGSGNVQMVCIQGICLRRLLTSFKAITASIDMLFRQALCLSLKRKPKRRLRRQTQYQ